MKKIIIGEIFQNENFKVGHAFTVEKMNDIEIGDFEKFAKKVKNFIKRNGDYQSSESGSYDAFWPVRECSMFTNIEAEDEELLRI